jgi:outer membrane protein assembly factor BamB
MILKKNNFLVKGKGALAVFILVAVISSSLLSCNLPDLSGKSISKSAISAESKENKKKEKTEAIDTYIPDATNYPFFRGQDGRGIAGGTGFPVEWNGEYGKNIKWKITVPKNGKSSPVIWGDKLFITGSDGTACEVYCINKNTGKITWSATASGIPGEPSSPPETDFEAGIAAPTAATDGKSVCAIFANGNLICLDMDGKMKWAKNIGIPANAYGYSCSLIMYKGALLVKYDSNEKVSMMAFNTDTGELKWETVRRGRATWSSPVIATFEGEPQVIINGNPEVIAFSAETGKELWSIEVLTGDVAPSLAVNSRMVYAVTDYARLAAVKPGPDPTIVWEDNMFTSDASSPVSTENYLFIATGVGDVACYDAIKGDTLWTKYFQDQFYASPIVADGKVWLLDRAGVMHIINAGPEYQLVAESPLGEPSDCTPAFSDKKIYIRTRNNLFCISAN